MARRWADMPDGEAVTHIIREMRTTLSEIVEIERACGHPIISPEERREFLGAMHRLIDIYGDCDVIPIDRNG